jgi:hypothetical protein
LKARSFGLAPSLIGIFIQRLGLSVAQKSETKILDLDAKKY